MGLGRMLTRMTSRSTSVLDLGDGGTFTTTDNISFFRAAEVGLDVNRDEALSLSTVYRAVNFLAGTQAILDLDAYKRSDKSLVRSMLLEDPSLNWTFTPSEWRYYELRSRLLRGNSFALKLGMTAASPWPRNLAPLDPDRVTVWPVYKQGRLNGVIYVVIPPGGVRFAPGLGFQELMDVVDDTYLVLERDRMFHVPGQNFDGVQGYSPIDVAGVALATEVATERATASFFGKGQLMSGFLRTDKKLDQVQADALKARWQKKMAGVQNAYEVAVLDNGLTFQPISVTPEQAQFLQMRQFNVEQVARLFGVPPFLLMASGAGNAFGTGLEQQLTATDIFTLSYWFKTLEDRVSMELLPGTQVAKFDKAPLERADVKSRWAAYAIARKNGLLSVDEIRDAEGYSAIGSDEATDPLAPVPQGTPASEPGGNDGLQGGGSESDIGNTEPGQEDQ